MTHALLQADAVEAMRALAPASVDLIVTDPAYESLEKHRAVGTTTRLKHSWFSIFPNARFGELFVELYRVLRRHSHLYVFCDWDTAVVMKPAGEAAGFRCWKPLIWDKKSMGMGYHYRGRYEMILFFEKGKRKLNDLSIPDVLPFKRIRGRGAYPTQKPVELAQLLIQQSSDVGDTVLDPFAGSGSFGVAATSIGRIFLGVDSSAAAVERAEARLAASCSSASPWPWYSPVTDRPRRP